MAKSTDLWLLTSFTKNLYTHGMSDRDISLKSDSAAIDPAQIQQQIHLIRSFQVMLDVDLAALYQVETRVLMQAVRRNLNRFPGDFMFQLSKEELEDWRSHLVISNPSARMGLRRRPYAFTEHGVLMLSSVLRSPRAVQVSIEIIRTFVRLRCMFASYEGLALRLTELEARTDARFRDVIDVLHRLLKAEEQLRSKRSIGFRQSGP